MKKVITCIACIGLISVLTSCGPSNNKIIEAQAKYREMVDIHNQVVAAHSEINDNSLDEELNALSQSLSEFTNYNLYEMSNEEINSLISSMDTVISSYNEYLNTIGEIKTTEISSVLTTFYIDLANGTNLTFTKLSLEEKGETDIVTNALETLSGLMPGQEIIGLAIHKDISNTPWILTLSTATEDDENETPDSENDDTNDDNEAGIASSEYQIEIDVTKIQDKTVSLTVLRDDETGELYLE